ncbi:MAG: hypothetical protein ACJ790_23090 [Myxococcaceae bacterium]
MRSRWIVVALLPLLACSSEPAKHGTGEEPDSGVAVDAGGGESDAGVDAGEEDAGVDAGFDAGLPDAGRPNELVRSWGAPSLLENVNSPADDQHPTLTHDLLTLCFSSTRDGGTGNADLYCAKRTDAGAPFGTPYELTTLNSTSNEWHPALSAKGDEIFFSSNRLTGTNNHDLFHAFWNEDAGQYDAPLEVAELNTNNHEGGPSLTDDGLTLYFDRTTFGNGDLYRTRRVDRAAPFDGDAGVLPGFGTSTRDNEPSQTPGESFITFCSFRSRDGGAPPDFYVWGAPLDGGSATAKPLDIAEPPGLAACGPFFASDATLYFHAQRDGGVGGADIYSAPPVR